MFKKLILVLALTTACHTASAEYYNSNNTRTISNSGVANMFDGRTPDMVIIDGEKFWKKWYVASDLNRRSVVKPPTAKQVQAEKEETQARREREEAYLAKQKEISVKYNNCIKYGYKEQKFTPTYIGQHCLEYSEGRPYTKPTQDDYNPNNINNNVNDIVNGVKLLGSLFK